MKEVVSFDAIGYKNGMSYSGKDHTVTKYGIADLGGQWLPEQEPDISYITKENHLDADLIFQDKINSQKSAEEYLIPKITTEGMPQSIPCIICLL